MSRSASTSAVDRRFPARRKGEKGFALIEMLIAFVVLAVGLGVLFSGVSTAMRADRRIMSGRVASRVAQSLLEEAGISHRLIAGQHEGMTGGIYRWRETITPIRLKTPQSEPGNVALNQSAADAGLAMYWVEVRVQANDGAVANLAALKLASEATR
jgi:general secretion pathway protein I